MANVQLVGQGVIIKTAYEGEPDTNAFTDAEKGKLAGIQEGAQVNTVSSVNGHTGTVVVTASDVGLGNVDNTSDANKPVSTATQTALNGKISSDVTGIAGAIAIGNIVQISQEDYDALDPSIQNANTFLIPKE